jgi:DNA-binding transcriptional ArsR family regulator
MRESLREGMGCVKSTRRPAYVARLLALGHQLRGLLDRGEVEGVGELARRLGVSQPRVSQVLALTYLAPRIQAEIAALEAVDGVEPMSERPLRKVLRAVGWRGQVKRWGGGRL